MWAGTCWFRRALSCGVIVWAGQAGLADDTASTEPQPAAKIVPAEQTVLLKYRFQPGQFVYYEVSGSVRYLAQQAGQSLETFQRNETSKHIRVVSVDDDGSALLEPIIDRIKMSGGRRDSEETGDQTAIEFDSAQDKAAPTDFQSHKETIGKPMARFKYALNGELLAVRIIATDISKSNAASADKADPKMSFLIPLPKEAIAVGYRWKQKYDEPVSIRQGLTQQIPMLRQFELTEVSDGIATIKFKTSILALLNDPKMMGGLAQQTPSGTIEFDIERGLIRSRKSVTKESVVNAFGPKTFLQVTGESTEKLVPNEKAIEQVGFTQESDSSGK
ncbi:MAG: hypothetical protein AABP62_16195 [Planctomycetota bacterium]